MTALRQLSLVMAPFVLAGCVATPPPVDDDAIRREVAAYADTIALDLRRDGPRAWLRHFERTPAFFMASGGRMEFPTYDSADVLVEDLAKRIRSMELKWSDVRVDPLTPSLAVLAASFREVVTDTAGAAMEFRGYFTAVAKRSGAGWRLRNAHWSLVPGAE